MNSVDYYAEQLIAGAQPVEQKLDLILGDCTIRLRSNSDELLQQLTNYFSHITGDVDRVDIEVIAIEREATDLNVDFINWRREPGKAGRKDSYFDFPQGRLLRKVRTGMVFLQSQTQRIAAGPCLKNDNQVINFLNAQYMSWLQNQGCQICHASGLVSNGRSIAIAAFSGGGKSTLMLHMMANPKINFLTNDRLFLKTESEGVNAVGVPKLPRVNPGTIVHNPQLHPIISQQQREKFLALPRDQLWDLEQKYDVLIDQLYGNDRITHEAPLQAFLVLNWKRDSEESATLNRVDITERPDLLKAIMKASGPFHQYANGHFYQDDTELDQKAYLDVLSSVPVYEAGGGIDFDIMTKRLEELMGN